MGPCGDEVGEGQRVRSTSGGLTLLYKHIGNSHGVWGGGAIVPIWSSGRALRERERDSFAEYCPAFGQGTREMESRKLLNQLSLHIPFHIPGQSGNTMTKVGEIKQVSLIRSEWSMALDRAPGPGTSASVVRAPMQNL